MLNKFSFFNLIKNYLQEKLDVADVKLKVNVNFNDRGDFTLPLFEMSKKRNKEITSLAQDIQELFKDKKYLKTSYENGFLDFYLDPLHITEYIGKGIISPEPIASSERENLAVESFNLRSSVKRVVFEFSSPNIAKPFTIGHLRSTNIGMALSNIFEYTGDTVVRINYLGDWGTQFGKLLYAYKSVKGEDLEVESSAQQSFNVYTLNSLYVKFHTEAEKNKELLTAAQDVFRQLEQGNPQFLSLWRNFCLVSMEYFNNIYTKLNAKFDTIESESLYVEKAKALTNKLMQKGLAKVSQDAIIINLENEKLGVAILQKKDESTIYFSRDLAALLSRFEKYKFDTIFYIVGKEQQLHFKQLYTVAVKIDESLKGKVIHIPFGHFRFKGEKISTREGNIIYFEEVLQKGIEKVKTMLGNRIQNTDERIQLAERIAISALKYYDLKNHIIKDIDFSWDEALNFDGNTGPYILYGLVRIKSLFRKFREKFGKEPYFNSIDITRAAQQKQINYLLRKILLYYDFILLAKSASQPNILCNYIFDLLKIFNNYYQKIKIITDDEEGTLHNLYPFSLLLSVLRIYIELLGLEEVEFM